MDSPINTPVASFTDHHATCRIRWVLYADRLEWQMFLFGLRHGRGALPLEKMSSSFRRTRNLKRARLVTTMWSTLFVFVAIGLFLALRWSGVSWAAFASRAFFLIAFPIFAGIDILYHFLTPTFQIIFDYSDRGPVKLPFQWWQKSQALNFARQVEVQSAKWKTSPVTGVEA